MKTIVTAIAVLLGAAHVAAAQSLVQAAWLVQHLADHDVLVLDLRPTKAYAEGHVPASVPADYEHAGWRTTLPDGAKGALPPIDRITALIGGLGVGDTTHAVLISDDFGAAARVFWTFRVLGHHDVSILDGGWHAWTAADGAPVSTVAVAPTARTFTAHYDPSVRAVLPDVADAIATGNTVLLDARPPGQWAGVEKTPTVAAFGHLPHAVWIDQAEALMPDGHLKPPAALASRFADVGDKPVTAYCNTGHLAATDWFVLSEVLHHPGAKLYDGSLSEWAADPARPMVREITQSP